MTEDLAALREQGVSAWLTKPPNFEELAQVINQALHG